MTTKSERRNWIRQDKETGQLDRVTIAYVKERTEAAYYNWKEAIRAASQKNPIQNSFARYYPADK